MASASRSSHNSQRRTTSPLRSLSTPNDTAKTHSRNSKSFQQNGEWIEPPLRIPAPSFQDHPGITRQGVLEAMMPLGTLPTTKVKARAKGDPLRRVVQARNLGGLIVDEGRETPEAGPVSDSTRAGTLRTDGRSLRGSPAVDAGVEVESLASPSVQSPRDSAQSGRESPAKSQAPRAQTTPILRSPVQRARQETPVSRAPGAFAHSPVPTDSPYFTAVALANRNGSPEVHMPLAFLYTVAERDPELSRLLDEAVNHGSINDPDSLVYKKIKEVKKMFRSAQSSPRSRAGSTAAVRGVSSTESSRTETARKSVSPSAANHNTIGSTTQKKPIQGQHQVSTHSLSSHNTPGLRIKLNVNPTSSTPNGLLKSTTSSPAKESVEQAIPLSRRSSSSSSSLSSADSDVLNQPPPTMERPSTRSKRSSAEAALHEAEDPEVEAARKKLKLEVPKHEAKESNIRDPPPAAAKIAASRRGRSRRTTPRLRSAQPPDLLSQDNLQVNESLGGEKRFREETPTALGRPPKKQKNAPRTKTSPVKNQKKPAVAGIARPDTKRRGSVGNNGDDSESSDNNDYCSACGGPGYLLCCDGCDLSFHFNCLDPPYNSDDPFDGNWFCSVCHAQREPVKKPPQGLFAELQQRIEKTNPKSFRLPESVREYFKNVKTGPDGEYVDDPDTRPIRAGQEEPPNFKAIKDAKGNTIHCHVCGETSGGTRDIIPCDYCSLHWHLDCLDPPLANPPKRGPTHEKRRLAWMCPAHIDGDLRNLELTNERGVRDDGVPRTHRVRQPKNTTVVRTHLRRGLRNNGLIEVESESSDESGFESEELPDGVVYKLPRQGIKLDFIHKVKMDRIEAETRQREKINALKISLLEMQTANARKLSQDIKSRQFKERQAALNLVQFKLENPDLEIMDDELENLVMSLEAEAPPGVAARIAEEEAASALTADGNHGTRRPPSPPHISSTAETNTAAPTGRKHQLLLRMQRHITSLLGSGTSDL